MLQTDCLSTINLTTLASATAKFLNNWQTSGRDALRPAFLIMWPRFSAASRSGANSFMHGGSWAAPGGPAMPGGGPAMPGGGPPGTEGGMAPGGGAGGAVSKVGRFPVIGTCAAASPAITQASRPASTATRRKAMAVPFRSLPWLAADTLRPLNNLRISAARRQIALAPRGRPV